MPSIVGNIRAEDDHTHPPGPESNYNESVYFNFFDRERRRGGFVRIGNRPNEKMAEVTVIVWEPDGSAVFNYKRPEIASNAGWDAGGLSVEVLRPGEALRTVYDGTVFFLADPRAMRDPRTAFRESPRRRLRLDLTHEGVGPIYGHVGAPGDGNEFARAHYEQHMRVSGTIALDDGAPDPIVGHGLRDHSWGPRYWQSTPSYRWITANFGDDLGMVLSIVGSRVGGVFQRGDTVVRITGVELDSEYEPGTRFHSGLRAKVRLADGTTHLVEGKVRSFIPLRHRRSGAETAIGEGMTEYRLDGDRLGYGLSEYLDQPGETPPEVASRG